MQKPNRPVKIFSALVVLAFLALAATMAAERTPSNVAGTWDVKVTGDTGNIDQTIVFTQDGDKLGGTFKGPRQTGTVDGVMDGNNIKFKVNGRVPINYTGTVLGDTMSGRLAAQGKTGSFTGHRTKAA